MRPLINPNHSIKYLVLLFSLLWAKSSFTQIDHWETVVYENDTWKYMVPSSAVDPTWNTLGFNDASWTNGTGGFGYGDGDDNTVLPNGTISVYQRIVFNITDTSAINAAALTLDYDDSFVAYLNGVEITRDLLTGASQPTWNQQASGLHEAEMYQGIYPYQNSVLKAFLSANLNQGNNVLCVQTHNQSGTSSDLTSKVYLSLGMNIAGSTYGTVPAWFVPPIIFDSSNLPIVVINTGGVSVVNDPKIDATMGIIYNGIGAINTITDPYNEFYGQIGIEIRGSSSSSFPKKAYGIETRGPDSSNYNVSIFDWPIDNDWILYAPYSDKTLIRNVLTYKIGNEMGNYSPRTKLCEVVLNDEYLGVYVFMERIKQNPGRVNIDELNYEDTTATEITGGYIVKIDKTTGGGVTAWTSSYTAAAPAWGPIRVQLHDPELSELHPSQLNYIQTYITDFENALDGPSFDDPLLGYAPYIDVLSFIDFMLVNEISKNVDGYRISTFMYKEKDRDGGKLVAGPLWDFNLGWGNANYCQGGLTSGWEIDFNSVCGGGGGLKNPFYWTRFVQDTKFTEALNCRWQKLRQTTLSTDYLTNYIDSVAIYLSDAADRNFNKWTILGNYVWPNNFVGNTYQEEIGYLKLWLTARLTWMDANMYGTCPTLGTEELSDNMNHIQVYPNPFTGSTKVLVKNLKGEGKMEIRNNIGELIAVRYIGGEINEFDFTDLPKGLYFLNLYQNNQLITVKKLVSI